jgi:hypothetical protein
LETGQNRLRKRAGQVVIENPPAYADGSDLLHKKPKVEFAFGFFI